MSTCSRCGHAITGLQNHGPVVDIREDRHSWWLEYEDGSTFGIAKPRPSARSSLAAPLVLLLVALAMNALILWVELPH